MSLISSDSRTPRNSRTNFNVEGEILSRDRFEDIFLRLLHLLSAIQISKWNICLKVPASQPSVSPFVHPSVGSPFGMSDVSDPRPFGPKRKRRFGPKLFLTQDLSDTGAFRTQAFSDPTIVFFMNLLGYRVCIHVCLSLCLFVCLCLFFICGWVSWTLSVDNLEQ